MNVCISYVHTFVKYVHITMCINTYADKFGENDKMK